MDFAFPNSAARKGRSARHTPEHIGRAMNMQTVEATTRQKELARLLGHLARGQVHPLREARCAVIRHALSHLDGNVSQAAEMLGISRGTIYRYARL